MGGFSFYRSEDSANTFGNVGTVIHVDHHAITFDPIDPNIVYAGTDGGVYRTANRGSNWVNLNNTLAITQFYNGISLHPTDTLTVIGGTQDNGTLQYCGLPQLVEPSSAATAASRPSIRRTRTSCSARSSGLPARSRAAMARVAPIRPAAFFRVKNAGHRRHGSRAVHSAVRARSVEPAHAVLRHVSHLPHDGQRRDLVGDQSRSVEDGHRDGHGDRRLADRCEDDLRRHERRQREGDARFRRHVDDHRSAGCRIARSPRSSSTKTTGDDGVPDEVRLRHAARVADERRWHDLDEHQRRPAERAGQHARAHSAQQRSLHRH